MFGIPKVTTKAQTDKIISNDFYGFNFQFRFINQQLINSNDLGYMYHTVSPYFLLGVDSRLRHSGIRSPDRRMYFHLTQKHPLLFAVGRTYGRYGNRFPTGVKIYNPPIQFTVQPQRGAIL